MAGTSPSENKGRMGEIVQENFQIHWRRNRGRIFDEHWFSGRCTF